MGISALAVCCRSRWNAYLRIDQGDDEAGRPITTGRVGVVQRRSSDPTAIEGSAGASMVIAGRELAKQTGSLTIFLRADLDHDVSILITAVEVAGR
jgi:hypothetical protein